MKSLYILAGMLLIWVSTGCENAPRPLKPLEFNDTTTVLAALKEESRITDIAFSNNGRYVAAIVQQDGGARMSINGEDGTLYESVRSPIFRRGFEGVAFIARKNGKESVVLDGRESRLYDSVDKLAFAHDGGLLYAAKRGVKWMIVSGERESDPIDEVSSPLFISEDGGKLAYVEKDIEAKKSNLTVCDKELRNCVKGKEYDSINGIRCSRSGSRLVYVARRDNATVVVAVDFAQSGMKTEESAPYDEVPAYNISDNGLHMAFLGRRDGAVVLVKDGTEQPAASFDIGFELIVSDNGTIVHTAMVRDKVDAFVNGRSTDRKFSSIDFPVVSPEGSSIAYVAGSAGKNFVVVDGVKAQAFDRVVTPVFSPDGTKVIYRARKDGRRFVVVADMRGRTIRKHRAYEQVFPPVFSPDGKTVAYGVKDENKLVWIAEKL